jgi:uncharacterized membrane protein YkgB
MYTELQQTLDSADERFTSWLQRWSHTILRWSLAIVFVWFGALKVFGVTPVTDLVADTVYWFDPDWVVPALGIFEIAVGLAFAFQIAPRLTIALLSLQLIGTFLVFVVQPDVAFQDGNPLLLTVEGEFIVKNLVLISAALVIGATVRRTKGGLAPRP